MKKKSKQTQHDFILLDRSGSMGSLWVEALGSVNAYVKKLTDDKVATKVTLAVFDGEGGLDFRVIRDSIAPKDWNEVNNSDAVPRGMTPLNDATGKIVTLANSGNYDKVAIIIMTDGHENASRELSVQQAKKLLDDCRAKNWQVIFLGANFDNASQGAAYGNAASHTHHISAVNLCAATTDMAALRSRYAATGESMALSAARKAELKSDRKARAL